MDLVTRHLFELLDTHNFKGLEEWYRLTKCEQERGIEAGKFNTPPATADHDWHYLGDLWPPSSGCHRVEVASRGMCALGECMYDARTGFINPPFKPFYWRIPNVK